MKFRDLRLASGPARDNSAAQSPGYDSARVFSERNYRSGVGIAGGVDASLNSWRTLPERARSGDGLATATEGAGPSGAGAAGTVGGVCPGDRPRYRHYSPGGLNSDVVNPSAWAAPHQTRSAGTGRHGTSITRAFEIPPCLSCPQGKPIPVESWQSRAGHRLISETERRTRTRWCPRSR